MARLTPQEYAEKQARRLKASVEDIRRGVERVDKSPTEAAANKQEKMKARLIAAIDDGKWASGLRKVSLQDWKTKMLDKGVNRIASGIDAARAKVEDFASQLLPAIDAAKAKIDNMPDLTLEDSIARMTEFTREMSKFKKS